MASNLEPIEVFRGSTHKVCAERALVLRTLEIPFQIRQDANGFSVWVAEEHATWALGELSQYEEENRDWPPKEVLPTAMPGWFQGGVLYAATLIVCFLFAEYRAFGLDWYEGGVAHAGSIQGGELWRASTALGLHTGPPHLLSNLVFGLFFGGFVAWAHGGGLGWLAILVAGILGNITNAWLLIEDHRSVGASTAVFGAIGLFVGAEWRRRHVLKDTRLRRLAPILMGLLFFSFFGTGNQGADLRTDVTAHLTGLVWGVPLGALAWHAPESITRDGKKQLWIGALALLLFASAWAIALA